MFDPARVLGRHLRFKPPVEGETGAISGRRDFVARGSGIPEPESFIHKLIRWRVEQAFSGLQKSASNIWAF
jgi:hypothetical protein